MGNCCLQKNFFQIKRSTSSSQEGVVKPHLQTFKIATNNQYKQIDPSFAQDIKLKDKNLKLSNKQIGNTKEKKIVLIEVPKIEPTQSQIQRKIKQQLMQHQENKQLVTGWKSKLLEAKSEELLTLKLQFAGEAMKIGENDFAYQLFEQIINDLQDRTNTLTDEDNLAYARASYSNISIMKGDKKYEIQAPKALYFYNLRQNLYLQQYLSLKNNVAHALINENDIEHAIKLYQEILQIQLQYYSQKDDRILYTLNNMLTAFTKRNNEDRVKLNKIIEDCQKYLQLHNQKDQIYQIIITNLKNINQHQ